ncbi:hypothetical protein [Streptomyces sp. NRRL WC-3618]|uniref:hypothetical protein n=1 Tax=Streptomyces sp. NRRL WC-3618 TaxID=1519490 RepID=UPI001F2AB1A4|nr:hypothetical protein [Streptomyces sp. NRRL WC-3618]
MSLVQSVDGVPVFGNGVKAHVARDGRLISVLGSPVRGAAVRAGSRADLRNSGPADRRSRHRGRHGRQRRQLGHRQAGGVHGAGRRGPTCVADGHLTGRPGHVAARRRRGHQAGPLPAEPVLRPESRGVGGD